MFVVVDSLLLLTFFSAEKYIATTARGKIYIHRTNNIHLLGYSKSLCTKTIHRARACCRLLLMYCIHLRGRILLLFSCFKSVGSHVYSPEELKVSTIDCNGIKVTWSTTYATKLVTLGASCFGQTRNMKNMPCK